MIKGCFNHNYGFEPQRTYNFTNYIDKLKDISLYLGFVNENNVDKNETNKKVRFIVEYPNMFYMYNPKLGLDINKDNELYDLIYIICPFTCKLLNEKYYTNKYKPIFFPLLKYDYNEQERIYPVFYSGHIFNFMELVKMIDRVVLKYLGNDLHNNLKQSITAHCIDSYYNKLNIYSKTKICVVQNVLFKQSIPNMNSFLDNPLYNKHFPWQLNDDIFVPQIKSRMFEGAMMGCILLVYKDNYNLIETYFKENEDFIYFIDEQDLINKIDMILTNYDKYKYLAVNARNKFNNNYTLEHFVNIISNDVAKLNNK